jgi:DNA gyrase/topoisomerase IV subunit A
LAPTTPSIHDKDATTPSAIGEEFVLCVMEQGYGKRVSTNDFRSTSRGKIGVIAMKFKKPSKEEDKRSCFCIVKEDDEILVNSQLH